MLTTQNLFSICHHTVYPFTHFNLPLHPFPFGKYEVMFYVSMCFFGFFIYFIFCLFVCFNIFLYSTYEWMNWI